MISEACYHRTAYELHALKEYEDLTWIKLNRESVPKPHQYKRIFISKPNKNPLAITKAKGFTRLQIYH